MRTPVHAWARVIAAPGRTREYMRSARGPSRVAAAAAPRFCAIAAQPGRAQWQGAVAGRSGRAQWQGAVAGRSGRAQWQGAVAGR
eukprot:gene48585-43040_t